MTRLTRNLTIVLLCGLAATSWAQQMTNVRGTVTSFDGQTIVVASREGTPVTVTLPENVNVAGTKAITLADLKPGERAHTIRWFKGQVYRWLGGELWRADQAGGCVCRDVVFEVAVGSQW